MTIHDLKTQHATDHGFTDWQELRESVQDDTEYEQHWHAVCVRAQEQALSNAAGNTEDLKYIDAGGYRILDTTTITNKQNLVQ